MVVYIIHYNITKLQDQTANIVCVMCCFSYVFKKVVVSLGTFGAILLNKDRYKQYLERVLF